MVLSPGSDYTNYPDITRDTHAPTGIKYVTFGAYLPKGSYILRIHNRDHWYTLNRVAIAGAAAYSIDYNIRYSFTFTSTVNGWNYFSIERDEDIYVYTDTTFDGTEIICTIEPDYQSISNKFYYIPLSSSSKASIDSGY